MNFNCRVLIDRNESMKQLPIRGTVWWEMEEQESIQLIYHAPHAIYVIVYLAVVLFASSQII